MSMPTDTCPRTRPAPRRRRPGLRIPGVALLACLFAIPAARAEAFHDGGAGTCERCHVMHEGGGGVAMDGSRPLLLADTATDLCLTCHGDVFGRDPLNPPPERGAGNFAFLFEDNLNDAANGAANPLRGDAAGHNVTSLDLGTMADPRWNQAPGGTFPSNELGCTSCHDPHGNAGFRMLNGVGQVQGGVGLFIHPAPAAEGLDITDPAAVEARDRHTAYRAGISQWCANCHGLYHQDIGTSNFNHPVDEPLDGDEGLTYNRYAGASAGAGSGDVSTAYLPQVPIEDPAMTITSTSGVTASSRVMCLSCHRAHGSSAPPAGRWDFRVPTLDQDGVVSGSWPIPSPYDSGSQWQLCRKCHSQNHYQGEACITCHAADGASMIYLERP